MRTYSMLLITDIRTQLPTEVELDLRFRKKLKIFQDKLGKPLYVGIETSNLREW